MLAYHDWWQRLVCIQIQPGMTGQHMSFHWNNELHLWRVPGGTGHCHNDAAKANEKWNASSSVFLFSPWDQCCTHDWLLGEWFSTQTISSDTGTPCISHFYYTATHCLRGVFFLPEVEKLRTGSVCRPGNAFPSEIPNMRQTNILPTIH